VTVEHATSNASATAGSDYQARTNTVTIPAGNLFTTTGVNVHADNFREPTETFNRSLTSATNATIDDAFGVSTISANCYDKEGGTFAAASSLGSVSGDTLEGGSFAVSQPGSSICLSEADPSNGNVGTDWFKVLLTEDLQGTSEPLTADVELDIADDPSRTNTDLDLRVFDSDGTEAGFSENTGTADEFVFYSRPDTAADDSDYFYIAVFSFPNPNPVENDYNLRVTGDVSGGT
jgi:Calx-beta domain